MNTRTSPDVESAVRELEKRVIRLERNPSSGGLSQQEQARLEREFGRLEQEIQGLDARTSRPSGVPAWAVVAALVIGLAAGYLAHSAIGGKGPKTGGGPAEADSGAARSTVKFTLQPPSDLLIPLEDQPTADAVVLRYRSKDGLRKVAVYRYADAGKPSVIYALPAGIEALRRAARPSHGAPAPP